MPSGRDAMVTDDYGTDRLSCKQMKSLASVLFCHHRKIVIALLLTHICIVVLQEVVGYLIGLIPSHFYLVLGSYTLTGSKDEFLHMIGYSAGAMVVISFVKGTNMLVSGFLYLVWRERLTVSLHHLYFFTPLMTYKVNVLQRSKDNPDQRIAADADRVCYDLSQFTPVLLISPFTIAYYTYKCWQITGYIGPVSVFTFFIIATIINVALMRPVAKRTYIQEKLEGDFRYNHMLVRSSCEQAAFYRLNKLELDRSNGTLSSLLAVQSNLLLYRYLQSLFVTLCDYSVTVLGYVIVAIPIFRGDFSTLSSAELSSTISQYTFQSLYLFNCFTNLIDLSKQAAVTLGNSQRVADFIQLLQILQPIQTCTSDSDPCCVNRKRSPTIDILGTESDTMYRPQQLSTADPQALLINDEDYSTCTAQSANDAYNALPCPAHRVASYQLVPVDAELKPDDWMVKLNQVTITPPNSTRQLVTELSFAFTLGHNVLISGPSGVGKSSVLRVIGRLWQPTSGHLTVRGDVGLGEKICIVSQRPYFTDGGNFQDQIGLGKQTVLDSSLMADLVNRFNLMEVYERYKDVKPTTSWYDAVTPGEAQRIAILRVLMHRPRLVFMDESTSQVDMACERAIYEELRRQNVTVCAKEALQSNSTLTCRQAVYSDQCKLYPAVNPAIISLGQ